MKDKDKIALALRVFKLGHTTEDEAVSSILKFYGDSKRFNYHSFVLGSIAMQVIYLVKQLFFD